MPGYVKAWLAEYLVTQKITESSMAATLLDLARRGHLKIERISRQEAVAGGGTGPAGASEAGLPAGESRLTAGGSGASAFAPVRDDFLLARGQGGDGLHTFEKWLLEAVFSRKPPKTFVSFWRSVFQDKSFREQDSSSVSVRLSEVSKAHAFDGIPLAGQWASVVGLEVNGRDGRKYLDFAGKELFLRLLLLLSMLTFAIQFFAPRDYGIGVAETALTLFISAVLVFGSSFLFRKRAPLELPVILAVLSPLLFFALFNFHISLALLPAFFIILSFALVDAHFKYTLTRFTGEGEARYEAWAGLDEFLDGIENYGEEIPLDVGAWEKYLVYGVVFGNAERVAAFMRSLEIVPRNYAGFAAAAGSPSFLSSFITMSALEFSPPPADAGLRLSALGGRVLARAGGILPGIAGKRSGGAG